MEDCPYWKACVMKHMPPCSSCGLQQSVYVYVHGVCVGVTLAVRGERFTSTLICESCEMECVMVFVCNCIA